MTLSIHFPSKEVTFFGLGPINCRAHYFDKFADLTGLSKIPVDIAKVGLIYTEFSNAFCSFFATPSVAIPLSLLEVTYSIYHFQNPASSTAFAIMNFTFSTCLFAYTVKSTQNGTLKELSTYYKDSSKVAESYLKLAETGKFEDVKFSEPVQIPVYSSFSKVIAAPLKIVNLILEKIHMIWLYFKSLIVIGR